MTGSDPGQSRLVGSEPDRPAVRENHKGFPALAVGRPVSDLRGMSLAGPGHRFTTPVLLLRDDLLTENIQALQRFCGRAGLSLAPHVKTTMSPQLVDRQLAAGAWAVTVATPAQLRTVHRWGVRRVVLANQLVDPDGIDWLGAHLDQDPGFTGYCYVDSEDGVRELARVLAGRGQRRRLPVLVELGMPGGRSGARSVAEAVRLASLVAGTGTLRLAGVAGFEGLIDARADPDRLGEVDSFLRQLRTLADRLQPESTEEFLVTVGGSAYPELVRDAFPPAWREGRPIRVVLRSGCYLTHDSGAYEQFRSLVANQRPDPVSLRPALELWARVLSRPEPGLALVDLGRRDAGTDAGLPAPRWWQRRPESGADAAGPVLGAPPSALVALNDQHGYLRAVPPEPDLPVRVGDLVGFGITHPCTTLDKWRLIPVVDGDRRLTGAVQTFF